MSYIMFPIKWNECASVVQQDFKGQYFLRSHEQKANKPVIYNKYK